jgi:hypothetical protein
MMTLPLLIAVLSPPVAPGPEESAARATAMIQSLGDPEVGIRNAAQLALQRILPVAEKALRENRNHPDSEIASRCRALLAILDQPKIEGKWIFAGKIAPVDHRGRRIAIDVRQRDGAKAGDRLQVARQGEKIGVVVITEVQVWGSWAKPEKDTPTEAFQKNDVVERLTPSPDR